MMVPGLTPPRLVSAQFPIDHFTHIFIDEAGHCMEPESLVAIAGEGLRVGCRCTTLHGLGRSHHLPFSPYHPCLLGLMEVKETGNPGGQLVLAGDPRQLGPVLRSPLTQKYGLGYSLLERLLTYNALYKKGPNGYDPQFITKLLRNYRYPHTLISAASPCLHTLCTCRRLCTAFLVLKPLRCRKTTNWKVEGLL